MAYVDQVKAYLLKHYEVDEPTVNKALEDSGSQHEINQAEVFRSFPYYPGDNIAQHFGWTWKESADPDEANEPYLPDDDDDPT